MQNFTDWESWFGLGNTERNDDNSIETGCLVKRKNCLGNIFREIYQNKGIAKLCVIDQMAKELPEYGKLLLLWKQCYRYKLHAFMHRARACMQHAAACSRGGYSGQRYAVLESVARIWGKYAEGSGKIMTPVTPLKTKFTSNVASESFLDSL